MSKEMTMDEMIEVLARYRYNAKHDADRIKALEAELGRMRAEVERLNTGIQPEGSNDAVGRAVNVLLEKEKEIARLKAENEARKNDFYELDRVCGFYKAEVERLTNLKSGADYFKAKEGKQS